MITKKDLEMQIKMLVKDDQHSQETIVRQAQEIKRLNNIINELEKYFNTHLYSYCEADADLFEDLKEDVFNIIHEEYKPFKLKELKGGK